MTPRLGTLILATTMIASPALSATLQPSSFAVSVPTGTNSATAPYTDDVYLDSLTFGSTVYDGTSGSFSVARSFQVIEGRGQINAEWADDDDGADGDADPFIKAGLTTTAQESRDLQESEDPIIQDAALLNAFNSRSISEITDGEGGGELEFVVSFENSLTGLGDGAPDIVFIERGGNDEFAVELMIGGSVANPIYSSALTIDSGSFLDMGFGINTVEIGRAQNLWVGGFDFSDWGIANDTAVGGFRLTTTEGPDLGGFFLASSDPDRFGDPFATTAPVPLPAGMWLLIGGLGGLGVMRARRRA